VQAFEGITDLFVASIDLSPTPGNSAGAREPVQEGGYRPNAGGGDLLELVAESDAE